jgi:hypothetical protein
MFWLYMVEIVTVVWLIMVLRVFLAPLELAGLSRLTLGATVLPSSQTDIRKSAKLR